LNDLSLWVTAPAATLLAISIFAAIEAFRELICRRLRTRHLAQTAAPVSAALSPVSGGESCAAPHFAGLGNRSGAFGELAGSAIRR
jgi:hypothetical protein